MIDKNYQKELDWKQKYNSDLAEFRKKAYKLDNLMPKRYCLVLTNLCNLACDFCYQIRTRQKNALDSNDWIKLIKQLPENSRVTLTGGEPLVFKNFKDVFLETVKRHECNLICNGFTQVLSSSCLFINSIVDISNNVLSLFILNIP